MTPDLRVRLRDREWVFDASRPRSIGRLAGSDICVDNPSVSRRHGELRPTTSGWFFHDLASRRGSFVGERQVTALPITAPVSLRLGGEGGELLNIEPVAERAPPGMTVAPVSRVLRSAMIQPSSVYRPDKPALRVGRAPDNDIVVDDMLVSRHHAELRIGSDACEVVDLHSQNGTFVDGIRVFRAPVAGASTIGIGHHRFRLVPSDSGTTLEEYVDTGRVAFDAVGLGFTVAGGRKILSGVSFALDDRSLLAILGPSGAGKSTLTKALTGYQPATEGHVLYDGRDLYGSYDELRRRIGYVPQDDILHAQLTIRRALEYAAELRFPPDVTADERSRRVEEVIAELGLTKRADVAISSLSGGQRKRTSVALELLTKPSLLFLDEPTSGLDPGYEKSVMALLRDLADGGRSVIVITHSIQSLNLCDRILFLAPGGYTAYYGPPAEALAYFGSEDYADVFQELERQAGSQWHDRFEAAPACDQYVRRPLAVHPAQGGGVPRPSITASKERRPASELLVLIRRYISVITADKGYVRFLVAQAPFITLLILLISPSGALAGRASPGDASTVLLSLVLGVTFLGQSNAIREICKELPIYVRERAVGLSVMSYVASKAVVLGAITVAEAGFLVGFGTLRQHGPAHALSALGSARLELFIGVALTGLAAMAFGLLISALVSNPDKALTLLPVLFLFQTLLAGPLFDLAHQPVLGPLSYATNTRWGFWAVASTADLQSLPGGCTYAAPAPPGAQPGAAAAPQPPTTGLFCDKRAAHRLRVWVEDLGALASITVLCLALACVALYRRDPLRSWRGPGKPTLATATP